MLTNQELSKSTGVQLLVFTDPNGDLSRLKLQTSRPNDRTYRIT